MSVPAEPSTTVVDTSILEALERFERRHCTPDTDTLDLGPSILSIGSDDREGASLTVESAAVA